MNIIGQKNVIGYLTRGLHGNRLSPSLMFIGPEGVGKKAVAQDLAKSQCCQNPNSLLGNEALPCCDECSACRKIDQNIHPDFLFINLDFQLELIKSKAQSQKNFKIETIRHVSKFLSFKPLEATKRIVVMDDADTMSTEAANSLLKILEEPPVSAQLVLLVKDEHSLPSTIQSRCANLHFHPIPSFQIQSWLEKTQDCEPEKAEKIADLCGGSFSKALALIEDEDEEIDFSDYSLDEFFDLLSQPSFRREGRKKTEKVLVHLIEKTQKKMEQGHIDQKETLLNLLQAKKQLDRFVSPRLVLENLFLLQESHK